MTTKLKSKMRIAMLSIHSSPVGKLGLHDTGGMSVYIRELSEIFGTQGHYIDIYTAVNSELPQVTPLSANVRLVHLKTNPPSLSAREPFTLFADLPSVYQSLDAFRRSENITYDLIHSHYWLSGIVGLNAQKDWQVPHGITFHTIGEIKEQAYPFELEPELRIEQEKLLAEKTDFIVVSTHQERDFFIQQYNVSTEKVWIVPCGINLNRFQPFDKTDIRQQLGLDPEAFILLYVGRFVPIKGLDRLMDAMSHLKEDSPHQLILVGGDGPQSDTYKNIMLKIEKQGLGKSVRLTGRIDQEKLPLYYNAADLLVVPSYHESFGLVALESLACGTPVATTPVGGMRTLIKDGINGVIITDTSPLSFADQIKSFSSLIRSFPPSPERIRSTVSHLSWETSAQMLLGVYRKQTLIPKPAETDLSRRSF